MKPDCKVIILFFLTYLFVFSVYSEPGRGVSIAYALDNPKLGKILTQFGQHYQIPVASRSIDADELKAELLQRANSDSLPDAVIVPADFLGLPNLNFSPVPEELWSNIDNQEAIKTVTVNGSVLGLPVVTGNHLLLYVNNDLVSEPVREWEKLEQQRQMLPTNYELIGWSFNEMYWFIPFLSAFDGAVMREGHVNLDSEPMQNALAFYWQQAKTGLVDSECDYRCTTNRFEQGTQAYLISGFWAYDELKTALGDKLTVAALPSIGGKPMRSYFSSYVLAFPGNSLYARKKDSLTKMATYFGATAQQRRLWAELSTLPADKSTLSWLAEQRIKGLDVAIEQLHQSVPMSSEFSMAVIWEAMSIGFRRYGAGIINAEQASRLMQHLAEKSANANISRTD